MHADSVQEVLNCENEKTKISLKTIGRQGEVVMVFNKQEIKLKKRNKTKQNKKPKKHLRTLE